MKKTYKHNQIEIFAKQILDTYPKNKIFLLEGDLGSGKTTFVSAYAKILNCNTLVQSPTFILQRIYQTLNHKIYHMDLYRIQTVAELNELKLKDLFNTDDYVFIEWADKFDQYLNEILITKNYLTMNFSYGLTQDARNVNITYHSNGEELA